MRMRDLPGRVLRLVRFAGFYVRNLVSANLLVARSVVSGHPEIRPAVVGFPMSVRSDLEVTLLANLISLTPGTLTLDIDGERHILWVHALHVTSADDLRRHLADLERRLQEAFG